jgi:hypothetical protein
MPGCAHRPAEPEARRRRAPQRRSPPSTRYGCRPPRHAAIPRNRRLHGRGGSEHSSHPPHLTPRPTRYPRFGEISGLGGQESPSNAGYQYLCVVSKQTLAATSTTWKWRGACTCASSASRRCRPPRPSQSGGARRDIRHHRQRRQSRNRRAAAGRHAGKRSPKFSPRAISASNRLNSSRYMALAA